MVLTLVLEYDTIFMEQMFAIKKGDIMSKRNNTRLILDIKQTILIKNSETAKDQDIYGNLYSALQNYKNLSEKDLAVSSSFDTKAVSTLTNAQVKANLIKNIIDEWFAIDCYIVPGDKIPCQLCHTPNKKIYYIRNRCNENELHVGSDCITQFPGIENLKIINLDFTEKEKNRKQEIRRVEFAEIEVDDPEYVNRARTQFIDINILLPYALYNDIYQVLYNLNYVKTNYIQQGGNIAEVSEKYNLLKRKFEEYWEQATKHHKQNGKNKLACKKYISDWLKENHFKIWESISRNNGIFDLNTLKFAYENNFIKKHLSDFSRHLKDDGIKIIDVNGNSIRFTIQDNKYRYPVYFLVSNRIFMEQIGCYCLTQRDYSFNRQNLKEIRIEDYQQNIEALFNRMRGPMNRVGLSIEFGKYTSQLYYKRIPREVKTSRYSNRKEISKVGYKKIYDGIYISLCNNILFRSDELIEKEFALILHKLEMSPIEWLTQERLNEQEQIAKELSIQKQKEFVNYV
jgi:hypothetical protein